MVQIVLLLSYFEAGMVEMGEMEFRDQLDRQESKETREISEDHRGYVDYKV